MSLKIPSSFEFGIGLDLDIDGGLDLNLPTSYSIAISNLPPVNINLAPVDIAIKPLDVSFRIKEIPSVRAHLPLDYKVGFSLLGRELACIRLCGQGQVITEPYVPYPCEPRPRATRPELDTQQPAPG